MYPKLTKHQQDWLESKKKANTITKAKKGIKQFLMTLFGWLLFPAYVGLFIVAYSPGGFFEPQVWLQNPSFFLLILHCILVLIATAILWACFFAAAVVHHSDKEETKMFKTISGFAAWITWKKTLWNHFNIYKSRAITLIFISALVVQGWFVWATFFLIIWGLLNLSLVLLKLSVMTYAAKLSPEKINKLDGEIQGFVLDEIMKSLRESHDFEVDKTVEQRSDNTPIVTVTITSDRLPQTKILVICNEDSIAIKEKHYGDKVDHCDIVLSLPNCTEEIERRVVQLMGQRQHEASKPLQ